MTRAYSRWIEDLTSLPEYQASLQTEREKWEEQRVRLTGSVTPLTQRGFVKVTCLLFGFYQVCQDLNGQSSTSRREEELQEEVADLQTQLELVRKEQTALLKAELAAARAAWNRDKKQELGSVQLRCERACQEKLQEQSRKLELQQAKEEQELLLQMEAKQLQRTEEQRQKLRGELLAELRAALADVQVQFLSSERADEQGSGRAAAAPEGSVTHLIQTSCREVISRAVAQAKDEWRKVSWWLRVKLTFKVNVSTLIDAS